MSEITSEKRVTSKDDLIPMGPTTPGMSPQTQKGTSSSAGAAQGLIPISHKDFNEFIKGKGFTGRKNYRLKDLKAMFGFKPLTYRNQTTVNPILDGGGGGEICPQAVFFK